MKKLHSRVETARRLLLTPARVRAIEEKALEKLGSHPLFRQLAQLHGVVIPQLPSEGSRHVGRL